MKNKKVVIERADPFKIRWLRRYTVLLLRPHDIGDDRGDCLCFHALAPTAAIALKDVQAEAAVADEYEDSDDYKVLFCARGWHKNLACKGELLPKETQSMNDKPESAVVNTKEAK